jgi:predicted transposase YbfD/YdcC
VDDFGVQYVGKKHAQHLIDHFETDYTASKDWTGGLYCGINLKWAYENKHGELSMHGYIKDALHKYQHPMSKHP